MGGDHLKESPSQTAGPYVHIGCTPNASGVEGVYDEDPGAVMRGPGAKGEHITVTGHVLDANGAALPDVLVEIWQADADGRYSHGDPRGAGDPEFSGWGRKAADFSSGQWSFETVKPGPVPHRNGQMMAPHITVWIAARGINLGLQTRMYFPDEEAANAIDPILSQIPQTSRIPTLIATKEAPGLYRFDIHLQGENETIFFHV